MVIYIGVTKFYRHFERREKSIERPIVLLNHRFLLVPRRNDGLINRVLYRLVGKYIITFAIL